MAVDYAAIHKQYSAERKAETVTVKRALVKAGYRNVRVGHGTGTAIGWLHIKVILQEPETRQAWVTHRDIALTIAKQVTGRGGEHDGRVGVDIRFEAVML